LNRDFLLQRKNQEYFKKEKNQDYFKEKIKTTSLINDQKKAPTKLPGLGTKKVYAF